MADEPGQIATYYRIDPTQPPVALHGGLRGFVVVDRRDPKARLIALEALPDRPFRPRITLSRGGAPVPNAVLPVEYGGGRDLAGKSGWFVVGDAPPGETLSIGQPWRERDLIASVLIPAAAALAGLHARGLTHRAIHPGNLFRAGPRDPVTLGPFWAAPPASLQPAVYEPPSMARCLPNGRGEGCIADDVYALGVSILALATGAVPMDGQDEAAILRRKLELGSFDALTAGAVLPPLIADLLRGMLAEDPDHRPTPAMLTMPEQARARRVAARPARRAQVPIDVGGMRAWSARELALALGLFPERGYRLLKSGEVERWLRRCLGDPQLGVRVEDVTRRGEDQGTDDARTAGLTVMRCVAALDPLAPLVWRGIAVQPDGIGAALAGASSDVLAALQELVSAEAAGHYCAAGRRRQDWSALGEEQRVWRGWLAARGPAGGTKRLTYGMNPLLACGSPLLGGRCVVRAAELLPALDEAAAQADRGRPPIDAHIAAFLAARVDTGLAGDMAGLVSFAGPEERMAVMQLFGRLQSRLHPGPLPGLAGWLLACGMASVEDWRSLRTRAALQDRLMQAAGRGAISGMVEILDNQAARAADRAGAEQARARLGALGAALAAISQDAPKRDEAARTLGHEVVTGAGLVVSLGAAIAMALR